LKIENQQGIHVHAAAKFVKIASNYDIEVTISKDGQTVSGISIMGLLMLAAMPGDKIVLETTGVQAIEGLKTLSTLIKKLFEEL
jgi:phosphocarrier protein